MSRTSLTDVIEQQLQRARAASSGRSAYTVFGGHAHTLRQTVIALKAGQQLDEHESPGEATVYVLRGRVRMDTTDGPEGPATRTEGSDGDMLVVPDARHNLEALDDSVVLLTVAKLA